MGLEINIGLTLALWLDFGMKCESRIGPGSRLGFVFGLGPEIEI